MNGKTVNCPCGTMSAVRDGNLFTSCRDVDVGNVEPDLVLLDKDRLNVFL